MNPPYILAAFCQIAFRYYCLDYKTIVRIIITKAAISRKSLLILMHNFNTDILRRRVTNFSGY